MTDTFDRLKTALADRYAILEEVGAGGMATVYLAEDLKHERHVAIKVLRPELAAAIGPERFLREIKITAQLNHPHILPLLDSGDADGFLFYVMPYVEGESLRDRLNHDKQLPIEDAVKITSEVATALSFAHSHDVIHRDIKPENILLEAGLAVVADFGIAKAIDAAGGDKLTETGTTVGTPSYMSPEQAAGSRDLDGRSDIYGLGCVLYEMLAGEPPFTGPTVQSIVRQHMTAEAPSVTVIRSQVPPEIAEAVGRALAKTPADRFNSGEAFADAIAPRLAVTPSSVAAARPENKRKRSIVIAAAAIIALAVAGGVTLWPRGGAATAPDRVLVAPFENRTGVSEFDRLGELAAQWITQGISQAGIMPVVPNAVVGEILQSLASTSDELTGSALGRAAAREGGAGRLISGTFFRLGDRMQFQVEIIDVATGALLVAVPPQDGSLDDPEATLALVRQQVMGSLAILLDQRLAPEMTSVKNPPNLQAYLAFSEGLEYHMQGRYREAVAALSRAFALDSTFIQPLLQAASSSNNLGQLAAADSLLTIADGHRDELGRYDQLRLDALKAVARGDLQAELAAYRRRAELAPSSSRALYSWGWSAVRNNRPQEALEPLLRIDVDDVWVQGWNGYWAFLSLAYRHLGRYEEELAVAERGLARHPDDPRKVLYVLRALAALSRIDEVHSRSQDVSRFPARGSLTPDWVLVETARQLIVYGHPEAGRKMLQSQVDWYRARSPAEAAVELTRWRYARAASWLERWDEARPLLEGLVAEFPDNLAYRGQLGVVAAGQGKREDAVRVRDEMEALDRPFLRGSNLRWAARISAMLGEEERAVSLLADAYAGGVNSPSEDKEDLGFQSLFDYPPFQELVRPKG